MSDKQLAVLLQDMADKLQEAHDDAYEALKDTLGRETTNLLGMKFVVVDELKGLEGFIDNLNRDIVTLVGEK